MSTINRQTDLHFYQLIQNKLLGATEDGEIYEISSNKFLNKRYKENSYRRLSYKGITIQAHRFVWMFFNGLIPKDLQINHKNGKKHVNAISNLELMTNAQNTQHAYDTGLTKITEEIKKFRSKRVLGEKNINSKLMDKQVIQIRQGYINKEITSEQIQNLYSISRRAVEDMLLGRSYSHLPFISDHLHNNYKGLLSKENAIEIRQLYSTKSYTQTELGTLFNVSRSSIKDVLTYRTYKDITERISE